MYNTWCRNGTAQKLSEAAGTQNFQPVRVDRQLIALCLIQDSRTARDRSRCSRTVDHCWYQTVPDLVRDLAALASQGQVPRENNRQDLHKSVAVSKQLCVSGHAWRTCVRHAARVLQGCMGGGACHWSQCCLVEHHLSTSKPQSEVLGGAGAVKTGVATAWAAWATLERKWGTLLVGKKRSSERYQ